MFVSQERGASRKPFQKPNILRRKSKVVRLNTQKSNESPEIISFEPGTCNEERTREMPSPCIELTEGEHSQTFQIVQAPKFDVVDYSEICGEDASQTLEINGDSITIYAHNTQTDTTEPCTTQSTLNVESFLNNGIIKQNDILFNIEGTLSSAKIENNDEQKWSLNFMSEDSKDNFVNYYDGSQISNIYIDKTSDAKTKVAEGSLTVVPLNDENNTSQEIINVPAENFALDCFNSSRVIKLKCDVPNCNKGFWTEARLQKHKSVHNKQKSTVPTVIECPVKKTGADGEEVACGRTFLVRSQLMKHLNEDHSPEDALYRCTKCGRRFFYAAGARAHSVGSCTRAFTCGWAGCGRVFRQPCRLREHARAHTGDRPYPCRYPNCGWAFRSASKLMRHARGHTGERRHECAACGRAFPRREHLRDHISRHHDKPQATSPDATATPPDATLPDVGVVLESTPVVPTTDACIDEDALALGCEQTFMGLMNSMNLQIKDVNSNNGNKKPTTKRSMKTTKAKKNMFMVPLSDTQSQQLEASKAIKSEIRQVKEEGLKEREVVQDDVGTDSGEEGRCARTHCTWPLQRSQHHYSLEDETQVEQSEGSESNIYTVRSDLFLHGNLLINEDSEFIISRAAEGAGETCEAGEGGASRADAGEGGTLDAALGLIDSHPTIDLMQEELMYADAVDESSFRVLLLNGEELA